MVPLNVRLLFVFLGGACLGSLVNWAIYIAGLEPAAHFTLVAVACRRRCTAPIS